MQRRDFPSGGSRFGQKRSKSHRPRARFGQLESPGLASRIPYGSLVTREKLDQIAAGEAYLHALNFEITRVRNLDSSARIEVVPAEIPRLIGLRKTVVAYFKQIGFRYVTLDLEGFRSDSRNEILTPPELISTSR